MKHLLNNLTEEEKNSIREQHTGGMNVVTENFSKLINTKSGNVKLFLKEDETATKAESREINKIIGAIRENNQKKIIITLKNRLASLLIGLIKIALT